jgi:hypothetical protein
MPPARNHLAADEAASGALAMSVSLGLRPQRDFPDSLLVRGRTREDDGESGQGSEQGQLLQVRWCKGLRSPLITNRDGPKEGVLVHEGRRHDGRMGETKGEMSRRRTVRIQSPRLCQARGIRHCAVSSHKKIRVWVGGLCAVVGPGELYRYL